MRSRTARLDRRVAALGDPSGYPTVSAPGRAALDANGRDRLRSLPPASARSYCGNACTLATEWSDAARPPRVAGVSEMRLADRGLRAGLVRRSPGRGGADVLAAAGMQPGADRIALACRVCRGRRHPWWLTPRRSRVTPRMLRPSPRWSAGRTRWCRRSSSARRASTSSARTAAPCGGGSPRGAGNSGSFTGHEAHSHPRARSRRTRPDRSPDPPLAASNAVSGQRRPPAPFVVPIGTVPVVASAATGDDHERASVWAPALVYREGGPGYLLMRAAASLRARRRSGRTSGSMVNFPPGWDPEKPGSRLRAAPPSRSSPARVEPLVSLTARTRASRRM